MATTTLEYTETLRVTHCWCGIAVGIPSNLFRQAYDHGKDVYCPLGHTFSWRETEADRQRKRAEEAEREAQWEREHAARLAAERDQAQASARAHKGAATRARKRSAAAVCPCCKRSFVQLRRHMAAEHPDYDPSAPASADRGEAVTG